MGNNTQFKQILIDLENYNALKNLGKAGDSFNDVIRILIGTNINEKHDTVSSLDKIVLDPDNKSFMLRIDAALRKLGITYITCNKDHLVISFRGGYSVIVDYPNNMDDLHDAIESELKLGTELFESNIQTISCYISGFGDQIKSALKQIK